MRLLTANELREMGRRISMRRKQLSLTQEQLAEMAGLSQTHIAKVEAGNSGLADDSIIGLSKGLMVSTDYLLLGNTNGNSLLELMQSLNRNQYLALEEMVRIYVAMCNGTFDGQ